MKVNNKYIGVFDSGIGGLTCLKDLQKNFPNENFLYMGDTKRCPYGTKEKKVLEEIVESDIRYFEDKEVKMVVIACNTATANSYHIKSKLPIIRIIEPTCKRVNEAGGKTAILATNFTVNSKAYNKFLNEEPIGIGCSEWVDIIEAAQTNTPKSKESVERLLAPIKGKVDNIVLGCTHFGLLEDEIVSYLGKVNVINSSTSLVDAIKECLDEVGYSDNLGPGETIISVTGDPEKVNIGWFTKEKLDIKKVKFYD